MNNKTQNITNLLIVIALFLISFCFVFPEYANKPIGVINDKTGMELPFFKEIPFRLGLDLKGGVELLYQADMATIDSKDRDAAMEGLRDVIERRVNALGVREPEIQVQKNNSDTYHLSVKLSGLESADQAIKEIGRTPVLEFREKTDKFDELTKDQELLQKKVEAGEISPDDLYKPTEISGRNLKRADLGFAPNTNEPIVLLEFDAEGAKLFEKVTERNAGKPLAIFIDGQLVSAPMVREKISGGKADIEGSFTIDQAKKLARNLNEGALPVPVQLISQKVVGATLGNSSLNMAIKAGIIGFLLVGVFMLVFYKFSGFLAIIALTLYMLLNLLFFKIWPGFTLTLAGIGGFILSVGMAVDANILIFARMKEEFNLGRGFTAALDEAMRRAWPAIRDGNLTTIFEGVILYIFGIGFLRGFATTLTVGVLLSMFSAMFVTKTLMHLFVGTKLENIKSIW